MLLNCLKKISEKIIATRLSHFAKHLNLLHNKQIKDRKNRFAIDAFLCLLHDIQIAKNSEDIFSCLFLDVKDTFNYVSTKRLIAILHKLKMSNQLIRWMKSFMINRKIESAFNEKNKQLERYALKLRRDRLFHSFYFQYIFDFYFQK